MANHHLSESTTSRCLKHPDLHQLPGVCSSCLRERLYDLFVSSENYAARFSWTSSSLNSSSFSANSSSFSNYHGSSSPPPLKAARRGRGHRRNGSAAEAVGSVLLSVSLGNGGSGGGLRKSRSMAFVARNRGGESLKKRGFWSKLIHFKANSNKSTREGIY